MRDILDGKLQLIQNRTKKSDTESESEEGEIGDQDESDSAIENPGTSERSGYNPATTNPENELKLHTVGEMHTGENKNKKLISENTFTKRSNRKSRQSNRYDGYHIQKLLDINVGFENLFQDSSEEQETYRNRWISREQSPMPCSSKM